MFFLRPSVKLREFDFTQRFTVASGAIGCVIGEFERGPLSPTYVQGDVNTFYERYGVKANPRVSFAHDTVTYFMSESGNVLVKRVVNGALHAGMHVFNYTKGTEEQIVNVPLAVGLETGYDQGVSPPHILTFDANLVALNSFAMSVTDGVDSTAITPVVYSSSNSATMALIAAAIQSVLNTFGSGGLASVLTDSNGDKRRIAIYAPPGTTLEYTGAAVTLGATQAGVEVVSPSDAHLFTLMAENPGTWGNSVGYRITGRDTGLRQRIRIVFSGPLLTGNSFTMKVNDVAIASVPFNTDSDTTMSDIATAIAAHADVSSATVQEVAAGRENDRSILIVAATAGPDQIAVSEMAVTGGASQAAVTPFDILDGAETDGTFLLEIYEKPNTSVPAERYTVSLSNYVNGRGYQTRIDSVINSSSSTSIRVRVVPNTRFTTDDEFIAAMKAVISSVDLVVGSTITWMNGGDDGLSALSSQIRTAIQSLNDRVHYPFSILMNAGYTATEVQQELVTLAKNRNDCFAILDMPEDRQSTAQLARDYRLYELNVDSTYGAIYTPNLLIADIATSERRFIPPSGKVGAVFAKTEKLGIHLAPAGLNRGVLSGVLGLAATYSPADEELLHPQQVNCIVDRPGNGPVIMGEETLQRKTTVLSSIHARRLVSTLEVGLVDGLDYTLFEPHDPFVRNTTRQRGVNFLKPFKDNRALYDFRVQCDEKNNPPEVIDADALNYRVFLQVVRAIKGIGLDVILTPTGASFEEYEVSF